MATRIFLIRALCEYARDTAPKGTSIVKFLGQIRNAIISGDIVNGKVLVTTAEAGGTQTFALPAGHTPNDLIALFQEAIDYANAYNGNPPKKVNRVKCLRASFARAIPQ